MMRRIPFSDVLANHRLIAALAVLLVLDVVVAALGRLLPLESLLRGWLVAFAILSPLPIGSMVLLMIHQLTGGAWGIATGPVLRPAAASMPLAALAFIPVLIGLSDIYPWAADPTAIAPDVARWYLRDASFAVRAVVTLSGWSVLGVSFAIGLRSQLVAGLGLAFFGLSISLVSVDWYLSLEPNYVASAFAAMIAIQDLLMALAFIAVVAGPRLDDRVASDLGALLITALLGVVYLEFMTFVIAWYGDLPAKTVWFLKRANATWNGVLITSFVVGALLPLAMLLAKAIRSSGRGLRRTGALILCGATLHIIWLLLPEFTAPGAVLAAAVPCIVGFALIGIIAGSALPAFVPARELPYAE